jgi:hypothetical protein
VDSNENTGARELHLCHTSCALLDVVLLRYWLFEIRVWLDKNPDEVVTILLVNSNDVDARELKRDYARENLKEIMRALTWRITDTSRPPSDLQRPMNRVQHGQR